MVRIFLCVSNRRIRSITWSWSVEMDLFAILHTLSCLSLLREGQGRILFIPKTLPLLVSQAPGGKAEPY